MIVPENDTRIETDTITIQGASGDLPVYVAKPAGGTGVPGILVIHENKGVTSHIRDVVRRAAVEGFIAAVQATAYPDDDLLGYMRSMRVKHGLPASQMTDDEMKRLAKKLGGDAGLKVKAKLIAVKRGGRWLHFKNNGAEHKTKVSSSRTKVSIDGKVAKRKKLKAGMVCEISYAGNGGEAKTVKCSATRG